MINLFTITATAVFTSTTTIAVGKHSLTKTKNGSFFELKVVISEVMADFLKSWLLFL